MMKKIILLFLVAISFCYCKQNSEGGFGSKAEATENQRIQDSINQENQRIHMELVEAGQEKRKILIQNDLGFLAQRLQQERNELAQINQFQFGRSQTEKDRQLSEQNSKIQAIENHIRELQAVLPKMGVYQTFDFNKSPEKLLLYLFDASKNNDFSKFQYVVDPYGEGDTETVRLAILEAAPISIQNEIAKSLANGRIIGEIIFDSDKALVEIAIGSASNRLENVTLVNRMGNWYLYSF